MTLVLMILPIIMAGCIFGGTEQFTYPDIKDDFCGVHINFQYCKCAFHDELCDAIGMDQDSAYDHVNDEYDKWVDIVERNASVQERLEHSKIEDYLRETSRFFTATED